MKDIGLLLLRVVTGGLLAGHGSQKLFAWFGGHGPKGTADWLESIGMKPGDKWALAAGGSEFVGGLLTALGFLWPLGPITEMAPMGMAFGTVHWGKPIWVTSGGGELPVTNMATAMSLAMTGPGRISLDRLFRVRVPPVLVAMTTAGVVGGVAFGLYSSRQRLAAANAADDRQLGDREDSETPVEHHESA